VRKLRIRCNGIGQSGALGSGRLPTRFPEEAIVLPTTTRGGGAARTGTLPPSGAVTFERSSSSTRRRVIEAGARVFAENGFHAATKEKIGEAAGFSHQTVRDYFPTKEGLLGAIVSDAWRSVLDAMTTQSGASLLDQLMAGFDALDAMSHGRPAEARCVLHEAQIAGPKGAPLLVAEERAFKTAVEQIITAAAGSGSASVTARAEALVAAMSGLARSHVVEADGASQTRFSPDEARESFRMLAASMLQPVS
jgi:AcrR family transcriptional regulator